MSQYTLLLLLYVPDEEAMLKWFVSLTPLKYVLGTVSFIFQVLYGEEVYTESPGLGGLK